MKQISGKVPGEEPRVYYFANGQQCSRRLGPKDECYSSRQDRIQTIYRDVSSQGKFMSQSDADSWRDFAHKYGKRILPDSGDPIWWNLYSLINFYRRLHYAEMDMTAPNEYSDDFVDNLTHLYNLHGPDRLVLKFHVKRLGSYARYVYIRYSPPHIGYNRKPRNWEYRSYRDLAIVSPIINCMVDDMFISSQWYPFYVPYNYYVTVEFTMLNWQFVPCRTTYFRIRCSGG